MSYMKRWIESHCFFCGKELDDSQLLEYEFRQFCNSGCELAQARGDVQPENKFTFDQRD